MSISPATDTTRTPRFDEDIAASDGIRAEQARELLDAVTAMRNTRDAAPPYDTSSVDAYLRSLAQLRDAVAGQLGFPPPGRWRGGEPHMQAIGEDATAVYHRARVPVGDGVHAVGLYIVPRHSADARLPLLIALHGGAGSPEIATFHGGANYHDMVRGAVERGMAVWVPGLVFGAASAEGLAADVRQVIDARARLVGTTITALETMEIACSTEALLAARPELDGDRVGMVGLSYGGFYALVAGAFMPRVCALVSSCYLGGRSHIVDQTEPHGWSDWRLPAGATLLDDASLVALLCPRPLQVQMGRDDELFPVDTARRSFERAARPYVELGVADRVAFVECDGGHEFFGAAAWPFLRRHLMEKG